MDNLVGIKSFRTDSGIVKLAYVHPNFKMKMLRNIKSPELYGTPIEYDTYADIFLPRLRKPYPLNNRVFSNQDAEKFKAHYSEPISLINADNRLSKLSHYIQKHDEYKKQNPKHKSTILPKELETDLLGIGLRVFDENKHLKMGYVFKSLIDALSIMYLMNLTDQLGEKIKICRLKECNKPIISKGNYCCLKHKERDKKRNQRKNKAANENN